MASAMLYQMAQCLSRHCAWIGGAHERQAKDGATEPLYCPRCSGSTRSWVVDQAKEQQDWQRLQAERSAASRQSLDAYRASCLAQERLQEARQELKRRQARLLQLEADDPGDARQLFEAKRGVLKAEQQAAEAALASAQATAQLRALGEGRA
jgi:hypothetical protein